VTVYNRWHVCTASDCFIPRIGTAVKGSQYSHILRLTKMYAQFDIERMKCTSDKTRLNYTGHLCSWTHLITLRQYFVEEH